MQDEVQPIADVCLDGSQKLDVNKWRSCLTLPIDYTPQNVVMRMGIDAAPSANPDSDESAIAVGHFYDAEPWPGLALVDCVGGRWRGWALPQKIVDLIELWKIEEVSIECNRQHGGDLLLDVIKHIANDRDIAIPTIVAFSANNKWGAKASRARRIESDFIDGGLLKIRSAGFVDRLFDEVEKFTFDRENHGRLDSRLDAVSFLANLR